MEELRLSNESFREILRRSNLSGFEVERLKRSRQHMWTEAEAVANPRKLFEAVLSDGPQRVRLPNQADIILTLEQTDQDAEKSLAALLKRPDYPEGSD